MSNSSYLKVKSEICAGLANAIKESGYKTENLENSVDFSKAFGDISSSISFRLAKLHNKDPNLIANEIKGKIGKIECVEKITVEKGFINFHLDKNEFSRNVLDMSITGKDNKLSEIGKNEKVIIEYTSANPIHPLHVGQLRNALLGDSISKICEACNYKVEREDYIDDFGLQMVQAMWGYLNLAEQMPEINDKKFDHRLGKLYVAANKHMELHDIKTELSALTQLIEQDGTYESKITREVAEGCVRAQYETLFNYKIYHDVMVWESDIVKDKIFESAMHMLLQSGFIEKAKDGEYKDCIVMDLNKIKNIPKEFQGLKESTKVLVRSNGAPTYVAKDIAFHMWKLGVLDHQFKYIKFMEKQDNGLPLYSTSQTGAKMDFGNMQRAINIIDNRQSHPQEMLKLAFRGMGKDDVANNIIHLAYGRVELEEGALAGRKGTWIGNTADDVLEEAITKARTLIGSKLKLTPEEQKKVSEAVALSAIKFEFLKVAPEKNMTFSWEWALSFEGNSGPYAQYMHARATRILEEAPKEFMNKNLSDMPAITEQEFALVKCLSRISIIAEKAAQELRPNIITEYINDLAYAFAAFYESSKILKADSNEEKIFRLKLTLAFKNSMKIMLGLLGIDALERM
ncbi:MAG: arginine--tRNA ligase [Candidatus Micrarchaeaceae archaeon]|jgi:arginyl-tRNA synthetase